MGVLSEKVAIVTGGSRGIGAAIAARLAADGAAVVVNYVSNPAKAEEVVERIRNAGGRSIAVQADVSRVDEVRRLFITCMERFDGLDILVNNAGFTHMEQIPMANITDELYERIFDVNAKGTFLCLREAAHLIREGGRIVNMSSTGVGIAHPGHGIYTAAKSAVEIFTRVLAKELKGRRVTVNCIAPGATATDDWLEGKPEEMVKMIANLSPLNRLGLPEDIADAVAFLVSPRGEWINGQVIRANGGFA